LGYKPVGSRSYQEEKKKGSNPVIMPNRKPFGKVEKTWKGILL